MTTTPRVCVVAALRNVRRYIPFYREAIARFTLPPSRIVLYENDSCDGTLAALRDWPEATVFAWRTWRTHFPKVATAERAAHLAAVRNMAIEHALAYDDWDVALLLDAQKYVSPGVVERLVGFDRDIIAPLVAIPGGLFYDSWCFRHLDGRPFEELADGRPHFALDSGPPFEVAAVGGVYLVKRALLEAGVRLAGTDGKDCDSVPLCAAARARGASVWVDPGSMAIHCPAATLYRRYVTENEAIW